jgi:large subunit ribosomal protein L23
MKTILIAPIFTEATTKLNQRAKKKQYVFEVHVDATKPQIKEIIEKMYDVNVESIRSSLLMGKRKVRYTKTGILEGRKNHRKKAYVTLKEGQEINFFENV